MSSSRDINNKQQERIEKYCRTQSRPYKYAGHAFALAAGWQFGSGKFAAGFGFFSGAIISSLVETSTFERCVKDESSYGRSKP